MNFTNTTKNEGLLIQHLNKFLCEMEAQIDNKCDLSPEILNDYCEAALFMSRTYGRKGDRVNDAFLMIEVVNN